jgi:hypothetical protein
LRESAKDTLNRQLRSGIDNEQLAQLVVDLRAEDRLCIVQDETEQQEPQIICSLELFEGQERLQASKRRLKRRMLMLCMEDHIPLISAMP